MRIIKSAIELLHTLFLFNLLYLIYKNCPFTGHWTIFFAHFKVQPTPATEIWPVGMKLLQRRCRRAMLKVQQQAWSAARKTPLTTTKGRPSQARLSHSSDELSRTERCITAQATGVVTIEAAQRKAPARTLMVRASRPHRVGSARFPTRMIKIEREQVEQWKQFHRLSLSYKHVVWCSCYYRIVVVLC